MADPAIITAILVVVMVLAILLFISVRMLPVMSFIYPTTRLQARSELEVGDKKIKSLMDFKSVSEFSNALLSTEYGPEVQKVQNKNDTMQVHKGLEKGYLEIVHNVQKLSPEKTQKVIDAYIMFQEAKILKTIYRARFTNTEVDETIVFPVGDIGYSLLTHLMKAESVADLGVVMEPTAYSKVFAEKHESLEEFEVAIDNFVYHNFLTTLDKAKFMDKNVVKEMFKLKIDIQNLLALIRFHIRNVPEDRRKELLISNQDSELSKNLKELVKAENIDDILKASSHLSYHNSLEEANKIYKQTGSLLPFELNLFRYFKNYVSDISRSYPISSVVLFSYLIRRELEKRNLFAVSEGIEKRMKLEEIQELII